MFVVEGFMWFDDRFGEVGVYDVGIRGYFLNDWECIVFDVGFERVEVGIEKYWKYVDMFVD